MWKRSSGSPPTRARRAPRSPARRVRAVAEAAVAGEFLDVGERLVEPPPPSHSCSSRRPGVSITRPPPGRTISSRWLVVCRPSSSSTRVSFTAISSRPAKRFTSVDFPTPLQPSSTAVVPAGMRARSASQPWPLSAVTTWTGHADRHRLDLRDERRGVLHPVGLREHDLRRRAALPDRHEVALDPSGLELGAERADDERHVHVRGQRRGSSSPAPRRCARWPSGAAAWPGSAVPESDPVAHRDVDALVDESSGQAGAHVPVDGLRRRARRGGPR